MNRQTSFENKVLRRRVGFKEVEVARDWRKLHKAEFNNFCSAPSIVRN
jgi:hypothetical protein